MTHQSSSSRWSCMAVGEEQEEEEDWNALPPKLQQLLKDLARNAVSELPNHLYTDEYGGYFGFRQRQRVGGGDGDGDGDEGRYWRVRKRVLTAIANCHSLSTISIHGSWQVGKVREDEVSLLLEGLASNPSLKTLDVAGCEGFGRQAACEALGQLVASSRSLTHLDLTQVGFDAAGVGALAKGFNKDSVLEELNLHWNEDVGDAEGAQHLARILASAPRLKKLNLSEAGVDAAGLAALAKGFNKDSVLEDLDLSGIMNQQVGGAEGAQHLARILASAPRLKKLILSQAGFDAAGVGALAKGFNKESVLEELNLSSNNVGDAAGAQHLARILATAPRLKILDLDCIGMDVAGAQCIGDALPLCATLRELYLSSDGGGSGVVEHSSSSRSGSSLQLGPISTVLKLAFTRAHHTQYSVSGVTHLILYIEKDGEVGLADALAGMLSTNGCIESLDMFTYVPIHGLLEGLRHNSTISQLRLWVDQPLDEDSQTEDMWIRLVPLLQKVRVLDLQYLKGGVSFKKELLRSLEHNASLTELIIRHWD